MSVAVTVTIDVPAASGLTTIKSPQMDAVQPANIFTVNFLPVTLTAATTLAFELAENLSGSPSGWVNTSDQ